MPFGNIVVGAVVTFYSQYLVESFFIDFFLLADCSTDIECFLLVCVFVSVSRPTSIFFAGNFGYKE